MPSTSPATAPPTLLIGAMIALLVALWPAWAHADLSDPPSLAIAGDASVILDAPSSLDHAQLQQAMRKGALSSFDAHQPPWPLRDQEDLVDTITSDPLYDGTLELARQWRDMGLQAYRRVDMEESTNALDRALQNYRDIGHDLIAPDEIAEIQMYLALSHLEEGTDVVRPLEIFRDMIRKAPQRRIQSGYYPDFIVQYYDNARRTLIDQLRRQGPPDDQALRVGQRLSVDYVLFLYALPPDGDADPEALLSAHAFLFDVDEASWVADESIALDDLDEETLARAQSRLASRLQAYLYHQHLEPLPADDAVAASPGTSRLALHLQMSYGSFFQVSSPLEDPFGNLGISIGASWALTEEFEWITHLSVTRSMRDFSGLLRHNFTALRLFGGGELGRSFGPLRIAFGTGLEFASTGPISVFTDRSCIPDPDRLCPGGAGTETFDGSGFYWGIGIRPRISLALADSFELSTTVAGAYYLAAPQDDLDLNFPLSVDLGLKYRF